jgi:hypothetical protein
MGFEEHAIRTLRNNKELRKRRRSSRLHVWNHSKQVEKDSSLTPIKRYGKVGRERMRREVRSKLRAQRFKMFARWLVLLVLSLLFIMLTMLWLF